MATIKIRLLTSVAGGDFHYPAGSEVDAPEDVARDLLRAGHAALLARLPAEQKETAVSKARKETR